MGLWLFVFDGVDELDDVQSLDFVDIFWYILVLIQIYVIVMSWNFMVQDLLIFEGVYVIELERV